MSISIPAPFIVLPAPDFGGAQARFERRRGEIHQNKGYFEINSISATVLIREIGEYLGCLTDREIKDSDERIRNSSKHLFNGDRELVKILSLAAGFVTRSEAAVQFLSYLQAKVIAALYPEQLCKLTNLLLASDEINLATPFFTNTQNHEFTLSLFNRTILAASRNPHLISSISETLRVIVMFNCGVAKDYGVEYPPYFLPDCLQQTGVIETFKKLEKDSALEHKLGMKGVISLTSSDTIGEFLAREVKRTRRIDRWVGGEAEKCVLDKLSPRLEPDDIARYELISKGFDGEQTLLRDLVNGEPYLDVNPDVEYAIHCDTWGTLLTFDPESKAIQPVKHRIELLKKVQATRIPLYVCTGDDPSFAKKQLAQYGLHVDVCSKKELNGKEVLVLIDDVLHPENQIGPDPSIFIRAM